MKSGKTVIRFQHTGLSISIIPVWWDAIYCHKLRADVHCLTSYILSWFIGFEHATAYSSLVINQVKMTSEIRAHHRNVILWPQTPVSKLPFPLWYNVCPRPTKLQMSNSTWFMLQKFHHICVFKYASRDIMKHVFHIIHFCK